LEKKLVIEVDGAYHSEPHQARYDDIRTAYMHRQGFQVIRFTNEEILFNIEGTLDRIRILYYINHLTPLTPSDNSPFRG
jgi:very-short-patch-repair endonuclease